MPYKCDVSFDMG